jgi:hypothetical protein
MRIAVTGALVGALLAACTSSDVSRRIGARCETSDDCDQRCLPSGIDYPGGFCSITCASKDDCPGDTTCGDVDGGVCLFECAADGQCAFLGADWKCTQVDLRGGGIKVNVCRG